MRFTWTSNLKSASRVPKAKSSERREHTRYPFTATLEAFDPESEARLQGLTADLSKGGCYVDTLSPFPAQTRLKIRITREKRVFETEATVVYSVAGMGMGLRFEVADLQQFGTLGHWLNELSGDFEPETSISGNDNSGAGKANANHILKDLVSELMRKGALAEDTATGILSRLAPVS